MQRNQLTKNRVVDVTTTDINIGVDEGHARCDICGIVSNPSFLVQFEETRGDSRDYIGRFLCVTHLRQLREDICAVLGEALEIPPRPERSTRQ